MKILFLGDVTARSGRNAVKRRLPSLKEETGADLVIINGENAAHGKGITVSVYQQLIDAGADVITLGNHAFSKSMILDTWNQCPNLIRPANLASPEGFPCWIIKTVRGKRVAVVNVLGTVFMPMEAADPFETMDALLPSIDADIIIVDFHAETTAEKELFLRMYRDRVSAVIGTHTHVQTADEQIYEGCAYISDAGFCGSFDSILGRDSRQIIEQRFFEGKNRYVPSENPAIICGVVMKFDETGNRAVSIQRIQERP